MSGEYLYHYSTFRDPHELSAKNENFVHLFTRMGTTGMILQGQQIKWIFQSQKQIYK